MRKYMQIKVIAALEHDINKEEVNIAVCHRTAPGSPLIWIPFFQPDNSDTACQLEYPTKGKLPIKY